MRGVPRISHLLAHAEGGIPAVIQALRLSDDPGAVQFLDRYDSLSDSDIQRVSLEEVCVSCEVEPKRLLELAVGCLVEDSKSAGAIIAATYHPRVIRATAEAALNDEVTFDKNGRMHMNDALGNRKLFLSGTGFQPAPQSKTGGVFTTVNVQVNEAESAVPDMGGGGPIFDSAENDLKALHTLIDGNKQLEAPKVVVDASANTLGHQYQDKEMECIPSPKSSPA